MKYCEKCGQEIGNNKFCVYCGHKRKDNYNFKRIILVLLVVLFVSGVVTLIVSVGKFNSKIGDFYIDEPYLVKGEECKITFFVNSKSKNLNVSLYSDSKVAELTDDGSNGDKIANDGIYTLETTIIEKEKFKTDYYVKVDNETSEKVSVYFFEKPNEHTKNEIEGYQNEISLIEKEFLNNGYINKDDIPDVLTAVEKYAEKLNEENKIIYFEKTECSVIFKLVNGLTLVYEPKLQNTYSSVGKDTEMVVSAYQPYYSDVKNFTDDYIPLPKGINSEDELMFKAAEKVYNTFDNYSPYDILTDESVGLSSVRNFDKNQIILWQGHGTYGGTKTHSLIYTGSQFDWDAFVWDIEYFIDCCQDRVLCSNDFELFSYKYVDKYCKDLSNSFIYLGPCESGRDDVLANSFINKGASAVIGNSQTILCLYGDIMEYTTTYYLTQINEETGNYYTLKEALDVAKDKYGKDDSKYGGLGSEPIIFGGEEANSYRLADGVTNDKANPNTQNYISGDNLIEIDGKIICAKNDGVYYKESINNKGTKIASAKNVDILMSDGQTVFYVVCDSSDLVATETFSLPHTLYSVNIDGSNNKKVCSSENKIEPLSCYENSLYYFKQTDYGSGTLNKVDLSTGENIDLGSDILEEYAENWVDPMGCLGDKIYFFNKNRSGKQNKDSIVSYDLSTDKKNIELNDATFVFQQLKQYKNMLYFYGFQQNEDYKKTDTHLYTINSNNELSKSIELPSDLSIQIMDSNCEYVICFNDEQSDIDTMFDMYRVDLKTGDVITSKGEAGRYKNKNYFVTYDLANPEDIYFMYNVGLYDKGANKIVNKKHADFEIDIMKPMWIINGYVVDSNINTYKIYDESNDTSNIEKISSDEAVDIARKNAGGDGYGATYVKNVEYNGEEYYLINIKWRVDDGDGTFHYSHIGYSIVSLDGKDVKNADYINGQVQVY